MNTVLESVIEHHVWANDTLLASCEGLSEAQLSLTVPGTFGSVMKTIVHIAEAEQIYLSRIPDTGVVHALDDEAEHLPPVADVRKALRETGQAWRAVVERWPDDRPVTYARHGQEEHRSVSFFLVQMLDHGAEHRNHIRTILSAHGVEPPEIDGWEWDDARRGGATGRNPT
ncbi:MAG TPA: DinB family protein [Thermomicrobiales bacterium]|nr:DinB family protein [Thermomicrobiales bacterium]